MGFIIKQNLNQANVNETPINQLELVTDTGRLTYDQCVKYLFQLSRSFIIDNQGKTENVFKEPEQTGFWLEKIEATAAEYRFPGNNRNVTPDRWLNDGDKVELDDIEFGVIFTPGHTPGHVIFYHEEMKISFVGDVIFQGSIGRTDFPMGNHQDLIDSITKKLWPLGNDMRFVPGHGPMSTFGAERKSNPFVADHIVGKN